VNPPLHDVCCASLPPESVAALAAVRDAPGVGVALGDGRAWVRWQPGDETVLRAVLPVGGVELFARRGEHWYRHGHHLPAFDFPHQAEYRPLHQALTPAPARPLAPPPLPPPVTLTLMPDTRPRPASAMCCTLHDLARWADTVPAGRLETFRAARQGDRMLLVGSRLPPLPAGERFWGTTVLAPLGRVPQPDWAAAALREALGIADDELLLLTGAGAEAVPLAALTPLTRVRIRLAQEAAR